MITSIRLTRVTVRLWGSFNFSFMFYNFKTNFEKISSLDTDRSVCIAEQGGLGSEDFGRHDKIYLPDYPISLCNIHMILSCLMAMAIAMAANSL